MEAFNKLFTQTAPVFEAATALGSLAGGVGSLASALESSPKARALPALPKATTMPTPDDDRVRAARKKRAAKMAQRSGRRSTLLSESVGGRLG